jgi:hypothetical protein
MLRQTSGSTSGGSGAHVHPTSNGGHANNLRWILYDDVRCDQNPTRSCLEYPAQLSCARQSAPPQGPLTAEDSPAKAPMTVA